MSSMINFFPSSCSTSWLSVILILQSISIGADMRQLMIVVILVSMIVSADCQYLDCVDCPNGE